MTASPAPLPPTPSRSASDRRTTTSTRDALALLLLLVPAVSGAPHGTADAMLGSAGRPPLAALAFPRRPGAPGPGRARRARSHRRATGHAARHRPRPAAGVALAAHRPAAAPSFYRRLGGPTRVLAPMVAQSDLPFRLMCEQLHGVDLSYTQMIHAKNFVELHGGVFRTNHLDVYPQAAIRDVLLGRGDPRTLLRTPAQDNALQGSSGAEIEQARERILAAVAHSRGAAVLSEAMLDARPTIVQIAAHDPDTAAAAATMILERSGGAAVAAIDLNLGCPQSIARKGQYGAFLHDDSPELTYRVLAKLRATLPPDIGVTAKVRLPPTRAQADAGKLGNLATVGGPPTIDERMRRLIDSGVDLITVHGRTRFENKVAVGATDWRAIRQCVESARAYSGDAQYPVISNGGIEFAGDVGRCLEVTGASGVMASEGLLEDPGLFAAGGEDAARPASARGVLERQLGHAAAYLDYATVFPPLPGSLGTRGGSFNGVRSHLFKFLHRYLEENGDLRSRLGDQDVTTLKQARDLVAQLRSRYDDVGEEELRSKRSWNDESSWYRRHRGQNNHQQKEEAPSLSVEERKQQSKLRIQKMREERMKRSIPSAR